MIHIFLHFIVPALIATLFFKKQWLKAYIIMMLTMLVDLDHLLASPIYDPNRCSINFHPLHGFVPIAVYAIGCFIPKLRLIAIGLIIHMLLDSIDCQFNQGVWFYS